MAAIRETARMLHYYPQAAWNQSRTRGRRAKIDVALPATLRDGLLRRSEVSALTWDHVNFAPRAMP